ncbi:MAG: MmgE/PrpD family protein [Planctomycetes bacterium]|nr:MmgE/PrpD family protein [Planctomycetota bacterium]
MSPTLAERLADYAQQLRFEDLPAEVVHEVKRRLIDSFACALGALGADAPTIAARVARRVTAQPAATLIAGGTSSADLATFANGVLVRYLDFNDTYLSKEPAHPSDNLPAVLAAAEVAGRGGKDVICAAVLAYEVQCRLCDAASIRARGWDHVTYGSFSTALAAAKLFGCDHRKLVHALGLAGVDGIALRQTRAGELSMWKGCAFANSARNGVFAAMLAADGMTGPAPILEGVFGFEKLVSGPLDLPRLGGFPLPRGEGQGEGSNSEGQTPQPVAGQMPSPQPSPRGRGGEATASSATNPKMPDTTREPFMILRTYIKYWPAEYHSQSAIDAALQLRPETGSVDSIERIDIESFDAAVDIIASDPEKWRPKTRETADHSLPYCVAVALADGEVGHDQFVPARFQDEALLDLVARIRVHRDAALTARYPAGIPNRLRVRLKDGRELVCEVEFPRGHARNPMSDQEVEAKFHSLASADLTAEQRDELLRRVWKLEEQRNVSSIVELLAS